MERITQTTLLLNAYLLTNLSLRVATASATSHTPNIFRHCTAVSEAFTLNIFLPQDATTRLLRTAPFSTFCVAFPMFVTVGDIYFKFGA